MIPVSKNPEENEDYMKRFFKGFGMDNVFNYAKKNSEEELIQLTIQNSEEKVIQQVIRNSKEEVIQQVIRNSKEEVIQQVMQNSEEEVIQKLVEKKKGADVLDGLTQSGFSLEQIQKYLDSKKKN